MKNLSREPRRWHLEGEAAQVQYRRDGGLKPLLAACTGSGKTEYGVRWACRLFNEGAIDLVIVVAPTVNIKLDWITAFRAAGFNSSSDILNEDIRRRLERGRPLREDVEVIGVTYGQLAAPQATTREGFSLFAEYAKRYRVLLIADEIHHADDAEIYGQALEAVSVHAQERLALSGTPFNTAGGALAMCDSLLEVDAEGQAARRVVPFHTYSYGDAINDEDHPCRIVEFGVVYGKAETTYESLVTGSTFTKLIDLSRQRRDDSLRPLLDPQGEFVTTLLQEGLDNLGRLQAAHRNAAMLVCAIDGEHAEKLAEHLRTMSAGRYRIAVLLYDTEGVHKRIQELEHDETDIVVTVRIISEGIDVKRFRVGVYCSDARTRMFFTQFVGRFVRWQPELDDGQHAVVLVPGHVDLVTAAREIEQMILSSLLGEPGTGPGPQEPKNRVIGHDSVATDQELLARGVTMPERDVDLARQFVQEHPEMRGTISLSALGAVLRYTQYQGTVTGSPRSPRADQPDPQRALRQLNQRLVRRIAKRLQRQHPDAPDDFYVQVQTAANRHVRISGVDGLTALDTLEARAGFLRGWYRRLLGGAEPDVDA